MCITNLCYCIWWRNCLALAQTNLKKFNMLFVQNVSPCISIMNASNILFLKIPKTCSHVSFPNHPHASRRRQYGHKLVKEIVTKKGMNVLHSKHIAICRLSIVWQLSSQGRTCQISVSCGENVKLLVELFLTYTLDKCGKIFMCIKVSHFYLNHII